jgi:hypothetical protein
MVRAGGRASHVIASMRIVHVHMSQVSVAMENAFVFNVCHEEQHTCTMIRAPAKLDRDDERDRPERDLTHLVSDGTTF